MDWNTSWRRTSTAVFLTTAPQRFFETATMDGHAVSDRPIPNDMPRIDEGSADSTEAQRVGRVTRPANFGWNALPMQSRHELISRLRSGHVDVRSTYLVLQPLIADRSGVQSSFQTSAYHLAPCVGEPRPRHDLFHALLICAPRSKRVVTGGGGGVNVPRSPRAHPCGPTTALDASMSLRP
jgi:hypothetical protein